MGVLLAEEEVVVEIRKLLGDSGKSVKIGFDSKPGRGEGRRGSPSAEETCTIGRPSAHELKLGTVALR